MESSELFRFENLADFRVTEGYLIELEHTLWGTFPALVSETGEPFICLNVEAIRLALEILPKRRAKISKLLVLVNERVGIALDLRAMLDRYEIGKESESMPIVRTNDLKAAEEGYLKWAPGLIGNDMSSEEFEETLRVALAKTKLE